MSKAFKIILPAELEKSNDGEWRIRGLASTASRDRQGEVILQEGIDTTPIDKGRAYFNWDHQRGPSNILGPIDSYKRTPDGLIVEGRLFKHHSKAKSVHEIMSSLGKSDHGRMGMSVEGKILERSGKDGKIIKKCVINAVALTLSPVNTDTHTDLIKSLNNSEELEIDTEPESFSAEQVAELLEKTLAVGAARAEIPPNQLSGGDALSQEGLDKKPKLLEKQKKLKKMTKDMYKSDMYALLERLQQLYPEHTRSQIWEAVKDRLNTKYPELGNF